jgi:hypothetical protein
VLTKDWYEDGHQDVEVMEVLMVSTSGAGDEVMRYEMEPGIADRRWALCPGMGLEEEEDVRALLCA